ncbi:MAG: hypothetical protein WKG32_17225 [Gemmatimonadaceae bacterium]
MHREKEARILTLALATAALAACADTAPTSPRARDIASAAVANVRCDADNGGITLPPGFCAVVVADRLDMPRHMIVRPNGDLFVAHNSNHGAPVLGGVTALRDTDGDGKADVSAHFGDLGGNGIAWAPGRLFFAPDDRVLVYPLPDDALTPLGAPQTIVSGLPNTGNHISKTLVLTPSARLVYVNIGSATNSCQVVDRTLHSPGIDPCPELGFRAGVWRFSTERFGQQERDGQHFATGLRNMVPLALNPFNSRLYGVQHGRDRLNEDWPEFFTTQEGADLPAEELVRIPEGYDNGWPYCYFDQLRNRKVLAPEYGGDGEIIGRCADKGQPLLGFPGHWAPNAMMFYTGEQFPARYRGGAFVAFHGGFDRAPLPNEGYNVVFVPFAGGAPSGGYEIFADGFTGGGSPLPAAALYRPTGLAQGPDGSLYVSDDKGGRIWRIVYVGQ